MSLTNPNLPVTEARLQEFYERIKPYLGGGYSAGDGIEISNGEISTDNLQSGDMDDIVTPIPSIPARLHKYSTEEQIIGEWIDGKPLYQKTISVSLSGGNSWQGFDHNITNLENCINSHGWLYHNSEYFNIPHIAHQAEATIGITVSSDKVFVLAVGRAVTAYITLQYTKTTT